MKVVAEAQTATRFEETEFPVAVDYSHTMRNTHDHHEEADVTSPFRADASGNQFTRRSFLLGSLAAAGAVALVGCSTSPGATSSSSPTAVSGSAVAPGARAVRRITPPRLDTAYLGEKVHCYRPMRRGAPNLSADVVGDKVIAHNYGHGGSGWTLAPGSAQYVIDLVQETEQGRAVPKDADVTVVGAGVIGLFTAYELVQRGYTKVTVVAEKYDGLTSNNAGGLLAPVSMDNDPVMQAIIDKIGIDAYKFYAAVANGMQPDFETGAVIVPAYFENREESGLEPYVGQVMEPAKDVVLDFGNGTTRDMVAYDDGIFIDTAVFMKSLHDYLADKVTFETGKVDDLESLPSSLIFDCTGLGAGRLNGDAEMVSVQGHLVMLKDQVPADLQSMILVYYPKAKTTSGQEVKRSFYIFPKHLLGSGPNDVGVIGGTFIEGATPQTPNDEEFQIMIDGARNFYGI